MCKVSAEFHLRFWLLTAYVASSPRRNCSRAARPGRERLRGTCARRSGQVRAGDRQPEPRRGGHNGTAPSRPSGNGADLPVNARHGPRRWNTLSKRKAPVVANASPPEQDQSPQPLSQRSRVLRWSSSPHRRARCSPTDITAQKPSLVLNLNILDFISAHTSLLYPHV